WLAAVDADGVHGGVLGWRRLTVTPRRVESEDAIGTASIAPNAFGTAVAAIYACEVTWRSGAGVRNGTPPAAHPPSCAATASSAGTRAVRSDNAGESGILLVSVPGLARRRAEGSVSACVRDLALARRTTVPVYKDDVARQTAHRGQRSRPVDQDTSPQFDV